MGTRDRLDLDKLTTEANSFGLGPPEALRLLALARAGRRLVPYAKAYMDLRLEDEDAGTPPEGPPDEAECAAALAAFREADGG